MLKRTRGFTLVEMMFVVAIVGILASLAVPQFMIFQARAKQVEAKTNLRTWYLAQTVYFAEKSAYSEVMADVGFNPGRGNRFAYSFSQTCTYEVRDTNIITPTTGANCITVDQVRFPAAPLVYVPAAFTATFAGSGTDPGLPGLAGTGSGANIAALALANLDNEGNGYDTWLMSTKSGKITPCGTEEDHLVTGQPFQVKNDIGCD